MKEKTNVNNRKPNNKKSNNRKLIIPVIAVVAILLVGVTYAWLTQVLNGTQVNRIKAGTLDLVLDDETSNGIDLQYAVPQSDSQGLNNTAYTFRVINNGTLNASYKLYLDDEELEDGQVRMGDQYVKYDLVRNSSAHDPKLLSTTLDSDNKRVLDNVVINGKATNEYTLRLWIDSEATNADIANKVLKAKIRIEAIQTESNFQIAANDVEFDSGDENWNVNNVADALDSLREMYNGGTGE